MDKRLSIVLSVLVILAGAVALAVSLVGPLFDFHLWRLWPLVVVCAGLFFVLPPLLAQGKRGLGGLFIPGVPVLATGGILLSCSVFRLWRAWAWLWPQEVLAVAVGFLLAAASMRAVWLLIPAIIIGLNGLLLQFCAITGFWEVWTVLWAIEPLAVGLALLAVNVKQQSQRLKVAGITLCALALLGGIESVAAIAISTIVPLWWLWRLTGPLMLILGGVALLVWTLAWRRAPAAGLAVE